MTIQPIITPVCRNIFYFGLLVALMSGSASGGQGTSRMLYTSPNASFIEKTSGETFTTINDTSGQVATVQNNISTVRATNASIVIVIRLQGGATYWVTNAGLVLGSHECLVASGATLKAASAAVTVPLVTISSGSTNVSVAGGTLDGNGANINGIFAPSA